MNKFTVLALSLLLSSIILASGQEIDTSSGRVKGRRIDVLGKSVDVFHGIPFAEPPIGDLRFKHPQAIKSWSPEVKDATIERPSCIQPVQMYQASYVDNMRIPPLDYNEDCLYISIWKPSFAGQGSKKAVMFWIYGGSFVSGSTRIPLYNGQYLAAENDVIVVSVNYRVGPLGFSFLGSDTIPGNMGLMDQIEALKWVQNNIEYFNGDKDKITIFGQSAGGASVGFHLLSPLSMNLFNNAILQSGVPVHSVGAQLFTTKTEARNYSEQLSEAVGCVGLSDADVFNCMKTVDSQHISDATYQLFGKEVYFYPVIDDNILPDNPVTLMKEGKYKRTHIMTGVTKDEVTLSFPMFINMSHPYMDRPTFERLMGLYTGLSTELNKREALKTFYKSEHNTPLDNVQTLNYIASDVTFTCAAVFFSSMYEHKDVYVYTVDHRIATIPFPAWMGVPHTYELELVFGLVFNTSQGSTQEDKNLSRTIMTHWTNFAKSGNPNFPVQMTSRWPVFDTKNQTHMVLDVGSNLAARNGFHRHHCAFINQILPKISEDTVKRETQRHPRSGMLWKDPPFQNFQLEILERTIFPNLSRAGMSLCFSCDSYFPNTF